MAKGILERLAEGPVLGDGGYIVELEQRGWVIAGAFTPEVAVRHPDAVRELHHEMANAGAEVLQVMAFYGSRAKLDTVGEGDRVLEINRAATALAKEVAGDELLVAGDLSATWKWKAGDGESEKLVASLFDEQIEAQEGVDFWIGETFWYLGEAELCLRRLKAKTSIPSMITVAFRGTNKTDDGFTAAECAKRLADQGADIVGVNCMRDPGAHVPDHRGDARRHGRAPGRPAGRLSLLGRDALVHRHERVPGSARADPDDPLRAGRLCDQGARHGRQLHRQLLWRGRPARARDGAGARQARPDPVVGAQPRVTHERDRVELEPRGQGRRLTTEIRTQVRTCRRSHGGRLVTRSAVGTCPG